MTTSQVSVTARLERRSGPSGSCERRDTASRVVQLVCCSPALHGALLASRLRAPPGERSSRESLTQDSRSAVKARSSVTRIIRRGALHALQSWRKGPLKEAVTWVGALGHARKRLEYAQTAPMRAYVTGSDDAQAAALRARYGLTPRRVASSRLAAHEWGEGPPRCTHRTWRRSRGMARMGAGDACASLQAPRRLRWQRSGQRVTRWSPSY